jgi:undecaprenyl-diphosphatase
MAEPVSLVEALTLGVVQGLTEFLPISSTAHLRVVPALCHWQDPGAAYSAVIQLGSVVAVLAYFFKDLVSIATGALAAVKNKDYGDRDLRMVGAIIVGTIPICVIGLLLKPLLEQDNGPFRSINVIACASIVMGLLLVVAEKFAKHVRP